MLQQLLRDDLTEEDQVRVGANEDPPQQQVSSLLNVVVRQRVSACRSSATPASTAIATLDQYVRGKPRWEDAPIPYWTHRPPEGKQAAKLALRYLIAPATSVPSERVFSTAGIIISERRSSLKPEKACMLIFLRRNRWLC